MMHNRVYWLLLVAFGLFNAYQILPESDVLYRPFLMLIPTREGGYYDQEISAQAYLDYMATRVSLVCFYHAFFLQSREKLVCVFTAVYVGYLIDYVIHYNQPFFYYRVGLWQIPIMYSWIMFFFMIFVMIMQRKEAHGNL